MSIVIDSLTKTYGQQFALDNVSLSINSSEIVGLLGPNGAGKTTMMRIISCFIPPTSGNISVCGYDVMLNAIDVKRNVGYLPENNPLYLDMYVYEYLDFLAGVYKLGKNSKQRINEMIEITGLEIEYKKRIGALSKGYRQRVGIAQALIHNPQVLILDEPTSGLDPNQIIEIRNLIKDIGKAKTVIFSTHIMQEVEAICNRIVIINKGKIIKDDSTASIYSGSKNNKTIIVEFNCKIDENKLQSIDGIDKTTYIGNNTYHFETISNKDIRQDIFQFAVKNNFIVISMIKEEHTIEEIFHQLTKN